MKTPPVIPGGYVLLSRRIFEGSYEGRPVEFLDPADITAEREAGG